MFDDFNDDNYDDDSFDEEEWGEEEWEKFFQKEDEQKRRLQELLDKYGFTEEGLRKAFDEMGYEMSDDEEFEDDDFFDEDDDDEDFDDDPDEFYEDEYHEWDPEFSNQDHLQNAHPLFRHCYSIILRIMKMLKHVEVGHREHPIVIFQTGLFEAMSKLIRAGYDDMDSKLESERGLILAALKRVRKSLFLSLMTIPNLRGMRIVSQTNLVLFRNQITDLLKDVNREILTYKREH